ncbi:MAG: hypothetical protein ABEH81_04415 [Halopenitus sp.]
MATELLNTVYLVAVVLVAIAGVAVVYSTASEEEEGTTTRLGLSGAAIVVFVLALATTML